MNQSRKYTSVELNMNQTSQLRRHDTLYLSVWNNNEYSQYNCTLVQCSYSLTSDNQVVRLTILISKTILRHCRQKHFKKVLFFMEAFIALCFSFKPWVLTTWQIIKVWWCAIMWKRNRNRKSKWQSILSKQE